MFDMKENELLTDCDSSHFTSAVIFINTEGHSFHIDYCLGTHVAKTVVENKID